MISLKRVLEYFVDQDFTCLSVFAFLILLSVSCAFLLKRFNFAVEIDACVDERIASDRICIIP